ncbi:bifunctional sugar phosphate isomerase/epimerase/4-hydroxyphenylpyruvate dioxygenase family protein [Labrys wisconsinensis]|uniref:3-dehydroshikimate dehydratase n=1 Tax=Labrys wisconsinensis TaxID=425677 RepID=A0ABU0IZA0_9HYPH|nr:sugar phosphate isomerase/epimerase and 4-hydroxyphenylpyruvate domain-containing protein [Labrys wisconsinensis]MDQ0467335.1 4-hydroxyphenylpyruvate dioxygenase [Labrys wisconsinensis]
MKTSIATVSLSGDLSEKLTAIARAGFDGVEIFEADVLSFDHSPREVGRMVRDQGLEVTLFQPFRDFEGLPEPARRKAFDRAERKFDLMEELGTDLVLICSSVSPQALGGIDRAAADLRELAGRAARRGLRIGYEALAWGRFVSDHRDAWEIVRRADHPALGLILDSFHTLSRGIEVTSISSIPKEKLFLVQLADAPRLQLDLLSWSRHFRTMPGQGDLPVAEFVRAVQATGYDGVLSLEIFNDQFRAGSARMVALDGRRSIAWLLDQTAPAEVPAAGLPGRVACRGVAFLEFAVDEAQAEKLEQMLAGLGFSRRWRHRSRDVSVWTQNAINLVINKDPDGFARAFSTLHGPSISSLGLAVDDAEAAMRRARGLFAAPPHQAAWPGEPAIPAIAGVGGSLIRFVDGQGPAGALWSADFEVEAETGAAGPLDAVDHISQSMHYDEMLSWLLFYTALFDLSKLPAVDVADPAGLVRSQALQNPQSSLRLILNGSQGQRTLSSRFLDEFVGSGVQHVAFSTGDIVAAAERLEACGVAMLAIPANYYDDLAARFDLPEDRLATFARHGILYDRDADGEYLQIYTRAFADRFFFEIVERRSYRGFGAANAPIRLAAQTRLSKEPRAA